VDPTSRILSVAILAIPIALLADQLWLATGLAALVLGVAQWRYWQQRRVTRAGTHEFECRIDGCGTIVADIDPRQLATVVMLHNALAHGAQLEGKP
jgi:hypothetical protein